MPESREVYAWPEATLYVWTGNGSATLAFAERLQLQVNRGLQKYLFLTTGTPYAGRTQYVETNREVTLTIGALYAGQNLFGMLMSGANISASLNFQSSADGATATFVLWSAQMPEFSLEGGEGDVWRQSVKIIAPDISGF